MNFTIFDLAGTVGVALIIVTYALLQTRKIAAESLAYSALNAVGSALIVLSLFFAFNLSAFVVEILWVLISIFGIVKYFRRKKNADP